jgi:hypothetical protein
MSLPTLSDVRTACEGSPELKPLWDEALNAAYYLNLALGDAVSNTHDRGKRDHDKEARIEATTTESIAGLGEIFSRRCAALTAKLDELCISHPTEINALAIVSLCSGYPLPKSE